MPDLLAAAQPGGLDAFGRAVARLRAAEVRAEVTLREVAAPARLAPHAFALTAELTSDGAELTSDGADGADGADGRLILLLDPSAPDGWAGCWRIVTLLRAAVDTEMAQDPLLPAVGWSWLLDALDARGARHGATGGAVTRTCSARFGALAGPPDVAEIEIRASWSPVHDAVELHLQAWCDVLSTAAGLPPPGVAALDPTRH